VIPKNDQAVDSGTLAKSCNNSMCQFNPSPHPAMSWRVSSTKTPNSAMVKVEEDIYKYGKMDEL
jgi:hypothetical protein